MDEREQAEDLVMDWLHAFNPYLTPETRSSLVDRIVRLEAAERERCAKIAEQHNDNGGGEIETVTKLIAKEIRARAT